MGGSRKVRGGVGLRGRSPACFGVPDGTRRRPATNGQQAVGQLPLGWPDHPWHTWAHPRVHLERRLNEHTADRHAPPCHRGSPAGSARRLRGGRPRRACQHPQTRRARGLHRPAVEGSSFGSWTTVRSGPTGVTSTTASPGPCCRAKSLPPGENTGLTSAGTERTRPSVKSTRWSPPLLTTSVLPLGLHKTRCSAAPQAGASSGQRRRRAPFAPNTQSSERQTPSHDRIAPKSAHRPSGDRCRRFSCSREVFGIVPRTPRTDTVAVVTPSPRPLSSSWKRTRSPSCTTSVPPPSAITRSVTEAPGRSVNTIQSSCERAPEKIGSGDVPVACHTGRSVAPEAIGATSTSVRSAMPWRVLVGARVPTGRVHAAQSAREPIQGRIFIMHPMPWPQRGSMRSAQGITQPDTAQVSGPTG
jgi:hypothetical protein